MKPTELFSGGAREIYFWTKDEEKAELGTIVADSLEILVDDESIDDDSVCHHYTAGSYKVDLAAPDFDKGTLEKLFGAAFYPNTFGIEVLSVRKPRNLKYPRKKRKLRILKKWAKRFGYDRVIIPKAELRIKIEDGKLIQQFTKDKRESQRL